MERILDPRRGVGLLPESLDVALVLGEEQLGCSLAGERVGADLGVRGPDAPFDLAQGRLRPALAPRPRVPEPERRQEVKTGGLGTAVHDRESDHDVVRAILRVLDEHVKVPIVVEDAGVEQLVLELLARSAPIRLDEVTVRELPLRVLVEVLHVRVRRRGVDVEVVFLDVLAVVALAVGEPEEALLQDRVAFVPEGEGKAQPLAVVRDAPEAVLAPAISARPRLVVAEVVPRVAVHAVVFADRAPLPLAEIWSPLLPGDPALAGLVEPSLFRDVDASRDRCTIRGLLVGHRFLRRYRCRLRRGRLL